jgi:hypothetical protein
MDEFVSPEGWVVRVKSDGRAWRLSYGDGDRLANLYAEMTAVGPAFTNEPWLNITVGADDPETRRVIFDRMVEGGRSILPDGLEAGDAA